jgi:hypothetical protein
VSFSQFLACVRRSISMALLLARAATMDDNFSNIHKLGTNPSNGWSATHVRSFRSFGKSYGSHYHGKSNTAECVESNKSGVAEACTHPPVVSRAQNNARPLECPAAPRSRTRTLASCTPPAHVEPKAPPCSRTLASCTAPASADLDPCLVPAYNHQRIRMNLLAKASPHSTCSLDRIRLAAKKEVSAIQ